jgi:hypothetical protein
MLLIALVPDDPASPIPSHTIPPADDFMRPWLARHASSFIRRLRGPRGLPGPEGVPPPQKKQHRRRMGTSREPGARTGSVRNRFNDGAMRCIHQGRTCGSVMARRGRRTQSGRFGESSPREAPAVPLRLASADQGPYKESVEPPPSWTQRQPRRRPQSRQVSRGDATTHGGLLGRP